MSMLRGSENYIWNVTEVLGQGATGNVYKCRHKKTGELYAVKTFNSVSFGRPMDVQMREFEVLKKLCHENIVQLHAIEEETYVHSKVLVMDLCTGGSLFNILDDPENAYGINETEFVCVVRDVAAGLKHLRDYGIVHRDIKPGNIMRYITEDGRSVYKLIDFGAARELQDEEQFVSLYGTEEYLYPDMYERAVLRRPSDKQFTATVDLWSLGVTLYHIATGQLPFRPFGGSRRNKELMHKITTEKASGIISGVQHVEGGPVEYSRQLPPSCRLSKGVKCLITPLLAGLLESDQEHMMKFEHFFETVQSIVSKRVVYVFHVTTCTILHVYMDADNRMAELQEMIAEQTGVRTSEQLILYENHELSKVIRTQHRIAAYPLTSSFNPFYLFATKDSSADLVMTDATFSFTLPAAPSSGSDGSKELQLDGDGLYAKNCCAVLHCVRRVIAELLRDQKLVNKAAKMFRLVMTRDIEQLLDDFEAFSRLVREVGKRVELLSTGHNMLCGAIGELSVTKRQNVLNVPASLTDTFTKQNERYIKLEEQVSNIRETLEALIKPSLASTSQDSSWIDTCGCHETHICEQKALILVDAGRQTLSDFTRDRQLKRLSFNEAQIHMFEKHKLKLNTGKALALLHDHCLPNTRRLFTAFTDWYRQMQLKQKQLDLLKLNIERIIKESEMLTESLDQLQKERMNEMTSQLSELDVTVTQTPATQLVHSPTVSRHYAADTNGEFVFHRKTRTKQMMQDLRNSLSRNCTEIQAIKGIVHDNGRYLQTLRGEASLRPAQQQQRQLNMCPNTQTVAYCELEDTTPTLTST